MASKKLKISYLHPKYWLTWLVVGISWLLASIPKSWQYGFSSWVANRLVSTNSRRISTIR
ncbi:MAG: lipid A biosynthesis protein, partial [Cycloclasticus sp.]|nr:lipid A biosynthesis protein [Cycloclasticus sp.]